MVFVRDYHYGRYTSLREEHLQGFVVVVCTRVAVCTRAYGSDNGKRESLVCVRPPEWLTVYGARPVGGGDMAPRVCQPLEGRTRSLVAVLAPVVVPYSVLPVGVADSVVCTIRVRTDLMSTIEPDTSHCHIITDLS